MATYEYRCDSCNKEFEVQFPFGQAPQETECLDCKTTMKKIFGKTSIPVVFKGTGWAGKR
jgi:putative FmdB family regulatory protein